MEKVPFTYSMETYLWVLALACVAGFVKFINNSVQNKANIIILIRDVFTGALSGLVAFWLCEYHDLIGPVSNIAVVAAGFFGIKALEEIKNIIVSIITTRLK